MLEASTSWSEWDRDFYEHLTSHVDREFDTLHAYEDLASATESNAFRYLAKLILDDERRHHQLLAELAESVHTSAELGNGPRPVPHLDVHRDRDRILELTAQYIAVEEEDNRELKRLARDVKAVGDTTLWRLMLEIIMADNEKHRRILSFIRDRALEA
jgi:ferritin